VRINSNCREQLLKFEADGREFAKFLRSLKQCIQTLSHLFCTLIYENECLEKSNLRKISVPAHLIFFSVCHLNFFLDLHHRSQKKIRCAGSEIFLMFKADLDFSFIFRKQGAD
jgi:hypothetical protein